MNDINPIASDSKSQLPPENLVTRVWQQLSRATKDRHHHWRTPALASIGLDGNPQVRTVVLREASQSLWTFQAYTDSRSSKCHELIQYNRAQLVFWSPRLKWQLRVTVIATIQNDGEVVATAWSRMRQSKSSKDYLSNQVPGSTSVSIHQNDKPFNHSENQHYLAVINFKVISMDWLELGKEMHRRAHIDTCGIVTALNP